MEIQPSFLCNFVPTKERYPGDLEEALSIEQVVALHFSVWVR